MSAARKNKNLDAHLAEMKVEDIKKICNWNDVDQGGTKKTMKGKLLLAGNIGHINFAKVDLEELSHMQLFAKCVADELPSLGKRSELQRIVSEHMHGSRSSLEKRKKNQ